MNNSETNTGEKLDDIMKDIEQKVNPKTLNEGVKTLLTAVKTNDSSSIIQPMQQGAKDFEERVGRPMTYSEMREMWG
jgi:uncharacterized pyridoxal phosphate-containing UPF0001 family protein